jgi:PAS domain S-box-containing protein
VAPIAGWGDPLGLSFSAALGVAFSLLFGYAVQLLVKQRLLRDQLEVTIEAIPDIFWFKDMAGVYIGCNRQFRRFCGLKKTDIIGKRDRDINADGHTIFFRTAERDKADTEHVYVTEEWLDFADQNCSGLFEIIETPVRDPTGKPLGLLAIARDITERKQTEIEINRHRQDL